MSEKMIRGRDILLYINRKKVRGVLSLSIRTNTQRRMLKEYLCEEPYAQPVTDETGYITIVSLDKLRGTERPFVLTVFDKNGQKQYENCTLTEMKEEITPDEFIQYTYLIESTQRTEGECICGI